jgi:hypothetical protein
MATTLTLERFADVEPFMALVGGFLEARETEHNLMLGIVTNVRTHPELTAEPPYFAAVVDDRRAPVAAVVWTPPWQIVLSECDDPRALDLVLDDLADRPALGVHAPVDLAARFAAGWTARTGQHAERSMHELNYRLEAVTPPSGVSGAMRPATLGDRDLIIGWLRAFELELFGVAQPRDPVTWVDLALAGRGRELAVWDDDGPVAFCGAGGRTPNGIRIGPVYTVPEHRRRGYASGLVAAVCQRHLDAGRRFAFLMADATNPTSNHVYQAIGFEAVGEIAEYRFGPPVGSEVASPT